MDNLNQLISSLTPNEKKYIHQYLKHFKNYKSSSYLSIFKFISKHPDCSNKDIALSFKNENWVKNIPVLKNQLRHLVLKALVLYAQESNLEFSILAKIQHIEILIGKNLIEQAEKEFHKLQKKIRDNQLVVYYPKMDELQLKLLHERKESSDLQKHLNEVSKNISGHLHQLNDLLYAEWVNLAFFNRLFIAGKPRSKKEFSDFENLLQQLPDTPGLFKSAYIYYNLKAVFYGMTDEYEKSKSALEKIYLLFTEHPVQIKLYAKNYISCLNNLAIAYQELNESEKALKLLNEIKSLVDKKNFLDAESRVFAQKNKIALAIFIFSKQNKSESADITQLSSEVEEYLKTVQHYAGWYELYFVYSIAYAYFKQKKYHETIKHLFTLFNHLTIEKEVANDIIAFAKLLQAIAFYETKNFEQLRSFLQSTDYFLKKTQKKYRIEAQAVAALKLLAKKEGENDKEVKRELLRNINRLTEQDVFERQALSYFDFQEWCKSD